MYGNYDSKNTLPQFDLYVGVNLWDTVNFTDATSVVTKELLHIPTLDVTYICLVNTGGGVPFISALELRVILRAAYATHTASVALQWRLDFGNEDRIIRFPDDITDCIWEPYNWSSTMNTISTNLTFDVDLDDTYRTPQAVLSTAVTPKNASDPILFSWRPNSPTDKYFIVLYYGEVQKLLPNQTRQFYTKLNGIIQNITTPDYLYGQFTYYRNAISRDWFNYSLEKTSISDLPPIINALEVLLVKYFSGIETDETDAGAMRRIQAAYGVVKDWAVDPCVPRNYSWRGVDCSYDGNSFPTVISLNLSSSGLSGEISQYIFGLKSLQHLDLSNNNLTGTVPDFLTLMTSLTTLYLDGNNLNGSVPSDLIKRSQQGSLLLSVKNNPNLCSSDSCTSVISTQNKKKTSLVIPIVASAVVVVVIIFIASVIFWRVKDGKNKEKKDRATEKPNDPSHKFTMKDRQFTYEDIVKITNHFEKLLGKGAFGEVFYGTLDDRTEVAVKMLHSSRKHEDHYEQFLAEADTLMSIHHTNLTAMIGYIHEGEHLGLIFEYMANGNLQEFLSPVKNISRNLSWEMRLQIALDAAQGIEYLHTGCSPPIVHRDVKTSNILLNDKLQAKFGDFGISKTYPDDKCTHVTTRVIGTPGYMDPEFVVTQQLNVKSDVFAFGVVLFELITGQEAIIAGGTTNHIINWVSTIISTKGDVKAAIDLRLSEDFDINSSWKFVEIAIACTLAESYRRPGMNEVVIDLKMCLEMEKARKYQRQRIANPVVIDSVRVPVLSLNISNMGPVAR